jgi:hypothetical protein
LIQKNDFLFRYSRGVQSTPRGVQNSSGGVRLSEMGVQNADKASNYKNPTRAIYTANVGFLVARFSTTEFSPVCSMPPSPFPMKRWRHK